MKSDVNNSKFNIYYQKNNVTKNKIINMFMSTMRDYCFDDNIGKKLINPLTGEQENIEVIAAIVGEMFEKLVNKFICKMYNEKSYNMILVTLGHYKKKKPEGWKPEKEIINIIKDIINSDNISLRYKMQYEDLLKEFNVSLDEEEHIIKEHDNIIEDIFDDNKYINKLNFNLNLVKNNDNFEEENYICELTGGNLLKNIKDTKENKKELELLVVAMICNGTNEVTNKLKFNAYTKCIEYMVSKFLINNNLLKKVCTNYYNKIINYCEDNPRWTPIILDYFK
jgi:hypothetical protein